MSNVIEMPTPEPEATAEEDFAMLYGAMSWLVGAYCGMPGRTEDDLPDHVRLAYDILRSMTLSMVEPKKPE